MENWKIQKDQYEKSLNKFRDIGIETEAVKEFEGGKIVLYSWIDTNKRKKFKECKMILFTDEENITFSCAEDITELISKPYPLNTNTMNAHTLYYDGNALIVYPETLEHFGMREGQSINSEKEFWNILGFNAQLGLLKIEAQLIANQNS